MKTMIPLIAALVVPTSAIAQSDEARIDPAPAAAPAVPLRALGRADAPVTLDLYMSFICADCADWWQTVLPDLKARYIEPGQVRLVFHDVAIKPIQHSVRASMIGLCADPTRFFDVADAFMTGLPGAVADAASVPAWYEAAIVASGRTPEAIEICTAQEAVYEQVRAQNTLAEAAALPGLPGVVVNGQLLREPTLQAISSAVLFGPERVADPIAPSE